MKNPNDFGSLLKKAKELEKSHDWITAADFQGKALDLAPMDSSKGAEICDHIGFCYIRAAFQAPTQKDYANRMKLAVKAYERAVELYQGTGKWEKGKICHAKAMVPYANSWLVAEPLKKRELVNEWWRLEIEALKYWEETGNRLAFGRTCANLSEGCLGTTFMLEPDWLKLKRKIEEGFSYGEKAIVALSEGGDDYELARAYCWTTFYYTAASWYRVIEDRREEIGQKLSDFSKKALALSEKIGDAWLIGHSNLHAAVGTWAYTADLYSTIRYFEEAQKYGAIAKDKMILGMASTWLSFNTTDKMIQEEDPEKQREGLKKSCEYAREAINLLRKIAWYSISCIAYAAYIDGVTWLASVETDLEVKHALFQEAAKIGREGYTYCKLWVHLCPSYLLLNSLSTAIYRLSQTKTEIGQKRLLLQEALEYREKYIGVLQEATPFDYWVRISGENYRALIQAEMARIETKAVKKIELLEKAVSSAEKGLELIAKDTSGRKMGWKSPYVALYYYSSGKILEQLFALTKNESTLEKAIAAFNGSLEIYLKIDLNARVAECNWQIAKLRDRLGNPEKAALDYRSAAETYSLAAEKNPKLKEFYNNYSLYMQAWSEIEKARHSHAKEEYNQSRRHYLEAARLHESSKPWSYLAPNYFAWTQIETAEDLSRKENAEEAIEAFQKALAYFKKAEESIQTQINKIQSSEEKEMASSLVEASDLRRRYCQARIKIEQAKILYRQGEHDLSSRSYGSAAESLKGVMDGLEAEPVRKELKLIMSLCQAWEKMTLAEEKTSPELYTEASKFFEEAKQFALNESTSLLALGNSSFCKALAAGTRYQVTLDEDMQSLAKGHMKSAATFYLKAGFQTAAEYAKATQRLFDAYMMMNNAEKEEDPAKKAKYYLMAERVLQLSAGSFIKAKQPKKTIEVQRLLGMVREEKELAISLSEALQAPPIASSTVSFTTLAQTREEAAGLESFERANVQTKILSNLNEVRVGEYVNLQVEFVNAGKEPASLVKVEGVIPTGFSIAEKPDVYSFDGKDLKMKGKRLLPLKTEELKLVLVPHERGTYSITPRVLFSDEQGNLNYHTPESLTIKVGKTNLPNRLSTGLEGLDALLLGGVPKGYAVVLTAPSSDERELLVRRFLEAGANTGEVTFHITEEGTGLEDLAEKFQSEVYLFLNNSQTDSTTRGLPNVHRLKGKNLTQLGIALVKVLRSLNQTSKESRRACIDIVSDVLLREQAVVTRKWLSELLSELKSKSFTILAVLNPLMHPPDQLHAILDLFDGEISLYETGDLMECKKSLIIKKLRNQDYIRNPTCLTKQTL